MTFPSPVGLAAGFDKDADRLPPARGAGLRVRRGRDGHAAPAAGQPAAAAVPPAGRRRAAQPHGLQQRRGGAGRARPGAAATRRVVGVNVGKNKDTPEERAADDFAAATRALAPHADYVAVNVSSPNTPGLRDLQAVASLRPILAAVQAEAAGRPVLVKIAPDLSDEDVDAVARPRARARARRDHRHEHDRSRATACARRPPRSRPPAPAASRARRCARGRSRCCAGCARGPTAGSPSSPPAASATPTTRGRGSRPERTSCELYTGFIYGGPLTAMRLNRGLAAARSRARV